jgi:hypothetical protein
VQKWRVKCHERALDGERTLASCGCLAVRLKMRAPRTLSQTLRRTEWKSLLKKLPRTLAEYIARGKKLKELAH